MKRLASLPALAAGIVLVAVLTSLAPTPGGRASAAPGFRVRAGGYNAYGRGVYGGRGQGYYRGYNQGYGGAYGYRGYPTEAYRGGYGYGYDPYIRFNGRSIYYQPSAGRVYAPFGYGY